MVFDIYDYKLDEKKLYKVTHDFFGQEYNNLFIESERDIWKGISYGYFADILFCLPVNNNGKTSIGSTFICRPGSKMNFLSIETIKQLGISKNSSSSSFVVYIAGIRTVVHSSIFNPSNEDMNIIGNDFLSSFDCNLLLEYKDSQCYPQIEK